MLTQLTTQVFSLIHQLSTSTSTVSRFSNSPILQTPSADLDDDFGTDLTREHFTHLLEHCNIALSEVEVDDAFAYVGRSQGNVVHLFDLWQAVRETSLNKLRSQISENRLKQIEGTDDIRLDKVIRFMYRTIDMTLCRKIYNSPHLIFF